MGMVLSAAEVTEILSSDKWKSFVNEGGKGHEPFVKYVALRDGPLAGTAERTEFVAQIALRNLIAEFARREHHERGKVSLEMHPFLKQLVDHGDSVAFETIGDLGVAHGLWESELTDESRFPQERDVLGGKVNVRFLARLLRIGDLLDMDTQRADPVTAGAVAPLPPDAVPHWQQYSAKRHENISPEVIEFSFECTDQETHRVLRDWFGYLESEVRAAGFDQTHARRHQKWKSPRCVVSSLATNDEHSDNSKPTIVIKPARSASYRFHDWKLQLDQQKVLERLIYDVYEKSSVFIRELVQNAVDATRCQLYEDFKEHMPSQTPPPVPTGFDAASREKYELKISLAEHDIRAISTEETERRWVFTIEDQGTGMDEHIITRYFLQVGRSFYTSKEFCDRFKFAPASRFGVGFLSVFAVSNHVTVETARRDERSGKFVGIRLQLRGPTSYLLTESWDPFPDRPKHQRHGTRISVVLNAPPEGAWLIKVLTGWCARVEVPIRVADSGTEKVISYAPLEDGIVLGEGKLSTGSRFVQRVFEIRTKGVEGQLMVCAYVDDDGEGWCDCWPQDLGLDGERFEKLPSLPDGFVALHGITVAKRPAVYMNSGTSAQWRSFLDVRSPSARTPMSRVAAAEQLWRGPADANPGATETNVLDLAQRAIESVADGVVVAHLKASRRAAGDLGCYYVGRVLSSAPVSDKCRRGYPKTIITWRSGTRVDCSLEEVLSFDAIVLAYWNVGFHLRGQPFPPIKRHPSSISGSPPIVSLQDTPKFADDILVERLNSMEVGSVRTDEDLLLIEFRIAPAGTSVQRAFPDKHWWIVDLSDQKRPFLTPDPGAPGGAFWSLFKLGTPQLEWLLRLRAEALEPAPRVSPSAVRSVWQTAAGSPWNWDDIIRRWQGDPTLPKDLKPHENAQERGLSYLTLGCRSTVPR
jgi:hypothetical protein